MTVFESLRAWLLTCPLLEGQRLNANYLGAEPLEFALFEVPMAEQVAYYLDGTSIRQKAVAIAALQDYSPDLLEQLAASGFWSELEEWIEEQNDLGELPDLGERRTADSVKVSASHYVLYTSAQTARYQIQLLLTYEQEPKEQE